MPLAVYDLDLDDSFVNYSTSQHVQISAPALDFIDFHQYANRLNY